MIIGAAVVSFLALCVAVVGLVYVSVRVIECRRARRELERRRAQWDTHGQHVAAHDHDGED